MLHSYQASATESAALRSATPNNFEFNRPSVIERMAAAIVRLSKDGKPTCVSDLEHAGFTGGQISAHFPAAARIASKTVVRDINADLDGYDRQARIAEAAGIIAGTLPSAAAIHLALRENGFLSPEIGDLWPDIIARADAGLTESLSPAGRTPAEKGTVLNALRLAEDFMSAFEGDPLQEGIDIMLSKLRTAIADVVAANPQAGA